MWEDQNHPLWNLLTIIVVSGCATFFVWINCDVFDGEWKTIGEILLGVGTWETFKNRIKRKLFDIDLKRE